MKRIPHIAALQVVAFTKRNCYKDMLPYYIFDLITHIIMILISIELDWLLMLVSSTFILYTLRVMLVVKKKQYTTVYAA